MLGIFISPAEAEGSLARGAINGVSQGLLPAEEVEKNSESQRPHATRQASVVD